MNKDKDFLGTEPVGKLMFRLALPTITAQLINMLYNIIDRIYIGHIPGNGALALTGVGVCMPLIMIISAFAALVGGGGAPRASIEMGKNDLNTAEHILGNCFFLQILISIILTVILLFGNRTFLLAFGASENTIEYAVNYMNIYAVGTIFVQLTLGMNMFITTQGFAKTGMLSVLIGAVMNIVLDPLFIFAFHLDVAGAAIATALSNTVSVAFFIIQYIRLKDKTAISLNPRHFTFRFVRPVFSVGLASALATTLGNASNMVMVHLASGYGDIPVAAYGVVKRIDQFPLNVSMGLCQGFMPLVGYNFASKDYGRMRKVSIFSWKIALVMSACFIACFAIFAPQILHLFIPETQTSTLGASFLRIACLAVPLTSVNFLISYTLQAMGKGIQSAILTSCRQGLLNIPMLIVMDLVFGLYGMIWTQLVVEIIMLPVSLGMYSHTFRGLNAKGKPCM